MGALLAVVGFVALVLGIWGLVRGGIRWMRVGSRRASLLILAGGFVGVIVGAAINGPAPSAPVAASTAAAEAPKASTAKKASPPSAAQPVLGDAQWSSVEQNPKAYLGRSVAIDAEVEQTALAGFTAGAYSVATDPTNDIGSTRVVIYPPAGAAAPTEGDILHIAGTLTTTAVVQSELGAKWTLAVVRATSAQSESYGAAFAPALATAGPLPAQSENGLSVTVTKVEVAANQTRVFLTAANHTGTKAQLFDFEAALVQGGKQIAYDEPLDNEGYPGVPDDMLNDTTTTAVLIFDAVSPTGGAVTIDIPAGSADFMETWNDFDFTFQP